MPVSDKKYFEGLYGKYNKFEFIHPDPLEFLHRYNNSDDREIVGLVASSLAYGRVAQILKSVELVLEKMGSPSLYVKTKSYSEIKKDFRNFKHRFTTGAEVSSLLFAIKGVLKEYGSLHRCMKLHLDKTDADIVQAIGCFVEDLRKQSPDEMKSLIPHPKDKSACKRLCLYLRWMIRCDEVDPGGWRGISPSILIIPLDTHMHRICRELGLTNRKQADLKTAIEITGAFKLISPEDPVKYDFAITRLGIRKNIDEDLTKVSAA